MKTQPTTIINGSTTSAVTGPSPCAEAVLALFIRLLWAATLLLSACGAQAGAVLTTLYFFTGTNDGAGPSAPLVQAGDGSFYGTTYGGGMSNWGTVFKMSTTGAVTCLHSFTGTNDGGGPIAGLVQGRDGNFYGTTSSGGQGGAGTVFRLTIVPEFEAATLTNSTLDLTWSTEPGGTYQLQCNSDLSSTNWTNLGSAATATGATLSATDSVTNGPRRFYRVVVLSP